MGDPQAGVDVSDNEQNDLLGCFEHVVDKGKAKLSLDMLLPYLQVYQTWFYGYWPVLSVADLMVTLACNTTMDDQEYIELTDDNAMKYSLACSVCAAIATHISFVSQPESISAHTGISSQIYADEAKRVRNLFDYTANPDVDTLLSSFFLYSHYVNHKGNTARAIVYLREAISICQILGFHDPSAYSNKSGAETHRWKKIYYMLLVTERFMCFEDGMPVILESSIELPLLENEEYPNLLTGFTELVKVFSIPGKNFFGEINNKHGQMTAGLFKGYLQTHGINEKKKFLQDVQEQLINPLNPHIKISDSQTLNIVLSQSWIQAIAWHITSDNGLIRYLDDVRDCFSVEFPLTIAREFLRVTSGLPSFAFESNGPGVCVKLLEIANSLTFAIQKSSNRYLMVETLDGIFRLVNQFKNDVTLPLNVYNKVGSLIASFKNFVPRTIRLPHVNQCAIIEELDVEDKEEAANPDLNGCPKSVHDVQLVQPTIVANDVANSVEVEQFLEAHNAGFGVSPMSELVAGNLPRNFMGTSQQSYIQAGNCTNILGKISPVGSGTTLTNMFMHKSPSFR